MDGMSGVYAANIIAKHMWRSVNDEGYEEDSLHSIVDHRFSKDAVDDGIIYERHG